MEKIKFILPGEPVTKKNHSRIVGKARKFIVPSQQYRDYEARCGWAIPCKNLRIDRPVNLRCVYWMPTRRRVDLVNLLEATCDILVKFGVLADDCSKIVAAHDGSRVRYDKGHPRVEIEITEMEGEHETD